MALDPKITMIRIKIYSRITKLQYNKDYNKDSLKVMPLLQNLRPFFTEQVTWIGLEFQPSINPLSFGRYTQVVNFRIQNYVPLWM